MRIVFTSSFYGRPEGGGEISAELLVSELRRRGHDIFVITTRKVKNKDVITIASQIPKKILILGNYILDHFIAKQIKKEIKKLQPDLLHIQDRFILPATIIASKQFNIPIVATVRENVLGQVYSLIVPFPLSLMIKRRNKAIIKFLKRADAIISDSEYIKKELVTVGVNPNKISPIYVELPWRLTNPAQIISSQITNCNEVVLFAPGRLSKEKGFHILLRAFSIAIRKYPKVKLIIAGDGPKKRELEKLSKILDIERYVKFLGKVQYNKMQELFLSSDIVIVPSIHPEPFGRVALEAILAGKPVVASEVGGLPEIIEDKAGILVQPSNPEALAHGIITLIENPVLREKMGKEGKRLSKEKFNVKKIVEDVLEVYNKVMNRR